MSVINNFYFYLNILCLVGQGITQIIFISHLTGKKRSISKIFLYLLLLFIIEFISAKLHFPAILSIIIEIFALYFISRFLLKNQRLLSCVSAIFAIYISQLSFGIINAIEGILFPILFSAFIETPFYYLMPILATLIAFFLCICCYVFILKILSQADLTGVYQMPYIGLLLFPILFFFATELYILNTFYQSLSTVSSFSEAGKHGALLFLQILGLAALLCTLYAYRSLCRNFQAQTELQLLSQTIKAQKIYISEAQIRCEQTRAFRHDIQNHLMIISALLNQKKLDESLIYLQKLKIQSDALSEIYHTGNAIIDVLLGEKLRHAMTDKISIDLSLRLPEICQIDDFDWCVIFANALDNAIKACQSISENQGNRFIRIAGEQQGDFYLLTFENTCLDTPMSSPGIGLSNIKFIAEKYHGTIQIEKSDAYFSLNVLLNIS